MSRLIIFASFLLIGTALLWSLRRMRNRLKSSGQQADGLALEAALPLGPQKRLLSVKWKGMDLLIAESGASIELLSSTILQTASRRGVSIDSELPHHGSAVPDVGGTPHRLPCVVTASFTDIPAEEPDTTGVHSPLNFADLLSSKPTAPPRPETAEVFHA